MRRGRIPRELVLGVVLLMAARGWAAGPATDPLSALDQTVKHDKEGAGGGGGLGTPSPTAAADPEVEAAILRGLDFLTDWQHQNGSWDRLENPDPVEMHRSSGPAVIDPFHPPPLEAQDPVSTYDGPVKDQAEKENEELADTCLSARAMVEAVSTGRRAALSPKCLKAIDYLCKEVSLWDGETIYVQKRVFDPLHDPAPSDADLRYYDSVVDTFFALRFLVEVRPRIDDLERQAHVDRAVESLMEKITKRQNAEGTWVDEANPMTRLRKLEKGRREAPQYDRERRNIMTHCVAVGALYLARRHGVHVQDVTLEKATGYLRGGIAGHSFDLETAVKGVYMDRIYLLAAVSAFYQADATARVRLAAAEKAGGGGSSADPLDYCRHEVAEARKDLMGAVGLAREMGEIPTEGPAIDALGDYLAALEVVAPGDYAKAAKEIRRELLGRQGQDGHFPAEAESVGKRGDSTFGTAGALRVLMVIADHDAGRGVR